MYPEFKSRARMSPKTRFLSCFACASCATIEHDGVCPLRIPINKLAHKGTSSSAPSSFLAREEGLMGAGPPSQGAESAPLSQLRHCDDPPLDRASSISELPGTPPTHEKHTHMPLVTSSASAAMFLPRVYSDMSSLREAGLSVTGYEASEAKAGSDEELREQGDSGFNLEPELETGPKDGQGGQAQEEPSVQSVSIVDEVEALVTAAASRPAGGCVVDAKRAFYIPEETIPTELIDPSTEYVPLPEDTGLQGYWKIVPELSSSSPFPVDDLLKNSWMVRAAHASVRGITFTDSPGQLSVNVHLMLPGGIPIWIDEYHNKNGTPCYGSLRRDGRMGRSRQRAYFTTAGDLVVRCDALSFSGKLHHTCYELVTKTAGGKRLHCKNFAITSEGRTAQQVFVLDCNT